MAYATIADVEARITRTLSTQEETVCTTLLSDAAVIIDSVAPNAAADKKLVVSCDMVKRALGDGDLSVVPIGATTGSMSGLGYSQSFTMGSSGAVGELYLTKTDRKILGVGNLIGSYSPVQELVVEAT